MEHEQALQERLAPAEGEARDVVAGQRRDGEDDHRLRQRQRKRVEERRPYRWELCRRRSPSSGSPRRCWCATGSGSSRRGAGRRRALRAARRPRRAGSRRRRAARAARRPSGARRCRSARPARSPRTRSTAPRVDTPPLRAVNEITTIQKYGRMIGTETTSRNASSADWPAEARAVPARRRASARPMPGASTAGAPRSRCVAAPPSMHLDPRRLQQPPHVHEPPERRAPRRRRSRSGSATAPRRTRTAPLSNARR